MTSFATQIIETEQEVDARLHDFGLVRGQILAIADVAKAQAEDASPLMPKNAPGTLAYVYGVNELRNQLLDGIWSVDRTQNIESVINRELGLRIGFQNVDHACDVTFPPMPRSAKGTAAEGMSGPTLFDYSGVEMGTPTGALTDGVPTYYVMVGEDGSVELSHPIISDGAYTDFIERILIRGVGGDWSEEIDPETGPISEFDVPVSLKK
ncbi:hypothetical protein CD351_12095 [Erythrobacter sp. KY5]|uniref:hypothetical protein n=1 Tax=Erythrobacter sp. KY5 TaxID=2011159 RepID=UPI000DBEF6FF|nr:hypothetical protein [Erythrobacter sp. KY5]AWW75169.1 hypothetical protein CD351_12095 [Erythrobacter sp. KY5]